MICVYIFYIVYFIQVLLDCKVNFFLEAMDFRLHLFLFLFRFH